MSQSLSNRARRLAALVLICFVLVSFASAQQKSSAQQKAGAQQKFRTEKDLLGEKQIPADA